MADSIPNQKDFVKEQYQSARDLLKRYKDIKLSINRSNLDAQIDIPTEKDGVFEMMSVAEAILYKQYLADKWRRLYNSFHSDMVLPSVRLPEGKTAEEITELLKTLVPELYYNEKDIQKQKEKLESLMVRIDALIDKSNHQTVIPAPL